MHVLILAAGKSTRFLSGSDQAGYTTTPTKLLVPFLGLPLIQHVLDRALRLVDGGLATNIKIAVSDDQVGSTLTRYLETEERNSEHFTRGAIGVIRVPAPSGTASTVYDALKASNLRKGPLLLLVADTPLVSFEDLTRLVQAHVNESDCTSGIVLGVRHANPEKYGQLVLKKRANGLPLLRRIARRGRPTDTVALVNAGAMIVDASRLIRSLPRIIRKGTRSAASQRSLEASLNDVPLVLYEQGRPMQVLETTDYLGTTGIDTYDDLLNLEAMVGNALMSIAIRDAHEAETRAVIQQRLEVGLREGFGLHPSHEVIQEGIEGFIISKPHGGELGGDCFVADITPSGSLCYLIVDGRGHGIGGALNMIPVLAGFLMCFRDSVSTKHVLNKIHELCSTKRFQVQASAIYLILGKPDPSGKRKMFASSAGHPQLLVFDEEARARAFPSQEANQGLLGNPLEALEVSIEEATCEVSPGELIVGFTDGVPDAIKPGSNGKDSFGQPGIIQAVSSILPKSTKEIAEAVLQAAEDFAGGSLSDDATIMVLRVRRPSGAPKAVAGA